MPRETVFLFAGQGSQTYGMGRDLRMAHPVFDRSLRELDTMFSDAGLPGILAEMHRDDRGPTDQFDRFAHTHPAIAMVELALLDTMLAEGVGPDIVLGTSLGEYAAAVAAGVLDREDLTRAIAAQVQLTEELCRPGGMTAVLGDVTEFDSGVPPWDGLEVAAINYDRHFVVSGSATALDALPAGLAPGTACHRLPVRFAFHSAGVDVVAESYQQMIGMITLRSPAIRMVSCVTAAFVENVTPQHMWRTVRNPIQFADTIALLERDREGLRYIDLGPSPTLATFAKRNFRSGSGATAVAVLDPFAPATDRLERVRQVCGRTAKPLTTGMIPSAPRTAETTAVLFPGQGSQSVGMAKGLFAEFPELVGQADQILGWSVEEVCLRDPRGELDRTEFTQPALYVANALHYLAWVREHGDVAGFFAGHSLGEYNALWAADVFDFATGLRLVQRRGELMSCAEEGGMAAVLGLNENRVRKVLSEPALIDVDLANLNAPDQIVVSGPRSAVRLARQAFLDAGATAFVPLRVSGAFHSAQMEAAGRTFSLFLADADVRQPRVPVIANVTGAPYPHDRVRELLADQLASPVYWERSVRYLLDQGCTTLSEVGPGSVLAGLTERIIRARSPRSGPPVKAPPVENPPPEDRPPLGAAPGSPAFRAAYGVRHAYVVGSMYHGISSPMLVLRAARAGILAFLGAGGMDPGRVARQVRQLRTELGNQLFGVGVPHSLEVEDSLVDVLIRERVRVIEASGFERVTPALIRYRVAGLRSVNGDIVAMNKVVAKVTRANSAEQWLRPPAESLLVGLVADGLLSEEQARLAPKVPLADDVCVEADSAGHTTRGTQTALLPAVQELRDRIAPEVRIGAAGGLGTPEAVAAAFVLGADFVLTGSVNLCTVEAGISDIVKDMLERITEADTSYAPAGDGFENDDEAQVLARGVFFPARARRLRELYRSHTGLNDLDERTAATLQQQWFRRSFEEVWDDVVDHFASNRPDEIERAESDPRHRMALVFRWYLAEGRRLAVLGDADRQVDFQVQCGPALGAFNQWAAGTSLESWRDRHVDDIAERLMTKAANHLGRVGVSA